MKLNTALDLFILELQDLLSAEVQIIDSLPRMVEFAKDAQLKSVLAEHLDQTRAQLKRLKEVGEILNVDVTGKTCEGIKGLLKEGEAVISLEGTTQLLDTALISVARRIEHYEIAGYGGLIMFASTLKEKDVEKLLSQSLKEEKEMDQKLDTFAYLKI